MCEVLGTVTGTWKLSTDAGLHGSERMCSNSGVSGTMTAVWFTSPLEDSGPKVPGSVTKRQALPLEGADKGLGVYC